MVYDFYTFIYPWAMIFFHAFSFIAPASIVIVLLAFFTAINIFFPFVAGKSFAPIESFTQNPGLLI